MGIRVRHRPVDPSRAYKIHAWLDGQAWDLSGTRDGAVVEFVLPDVADPRSLRFKFHSTNALTGAEDWESDDFVRQIRVAALDLIWSFEEAARILYQEPEPPAPTIHPGDVLTLKVVTQKRFKGGKVYAWSPYDPSAPKQEFPETSRADPVSTFEVPLAAWMTRGLHFKLVFRGGGPSEDLWEPDSSNRVWTPGDGNLVWVKSGQVSVRHEALTLTDLPLEVLFPAAMGSPPAVELIDPVEDIHEPLTATSAPAAGTPLFRVAAYSSPIYPDAVYKVKVSQGGGEGPSPFERPFPVAPGNPSSVSRFVLGADGWVANFPTVARAATVVVEPRPASSFTAGLTIEVGVGTADKHDTTAAVLGSDGMWRATLNVVQGVPNWVRLHGSAGDEPRPYDWIDTARFFTPPAAPASFFTVEGVFGLTTRRRATFAEPPSRADLMRAAFGDAIALAGIFDAREMPHGATRLGAHVYFVVHAPHAASASLVLVDEAAAGGPARRLVPMSLTGDTLYWWCNVASAQAPPGTRYRFVLNEVQEVLDPASREVLDRGDFRCNLGDDPGDPGRSWSLVLDVDTVRASAHATPWQTMGFEALVLYELHGKRFTDLAPGSLSPLDLIADELQPTSRLGQPGYLANLPITALELMPVHEFKSTNSWGYNPAFFFAVDGYYGGSAALARLVNAAHASGRGVLLDLVYNHMNDSPLTQIARDVYRNGDAWGDRINSGHPMVREFFRQAIVHMWRTFGLDGFRFDDTKTIIGNIGGWEFLGAIRGAIRTAASAEGRAWPYFVAENDPKFWDVTAPGWSVMDGQWGIDEVYSLGKAAYDPWQSSDDHAGELKTRMDVPDTGSRPYFNAVRFAESHDSVSAQDPGNKRIAARPPFRQGLQMAKAIGAIPLLSKGVPMLFMGQEVGETRAFSFDNVGIVANPQQYDLPPGSATDNTRVLAWFRSLMGLRNDPAKGLRGDSSSQVVRTGRRTIAFTCGTGQQLFIVVTFGTPDLTQDSSWLGLPGGSYKEIFNSSWPAFQVEFEPERSNGGYDAHISSGQVLNLPAIGAVVLERR